MSNSSFISRTNCYFHKTSDKIDEWYHEQLLHPGVLRLIESINNIFIGKQWLSIFQTSPRNAKNAEFSYNKEYIMENFCPNFMISIHGINCA